MAERMTSESWRVVRFRWYTVLWPEESWLALKLRIVLPSLSRGSRLYLSYSLDMCWETMS